MSEGEAPRLRAAALGLLARREHSRDELRRKLHTSGYSPDQIELELDVLANEGLQSDRRFGECYLVQRAEKGYGPQRLMLELRERGISGELARELLDASEIDWQLRAARVREKRFGGEVPADFRSRARQMRFLQYRGFDGDQINHAIQDNE